MEQSQIIIDLGMKSIRISLNELLYVTTVKKQDHLLCFITRNESYYYRGILSYYDNDRYPTFFRCHRSIIVNLKAIKKIDRSQKKIHFIDTTKSCMISRRKLSTLIKHWKHYCRHQ
jgi:two-component system response regulator AgrA